MANFVILDTSIYRELGLRFDENLDYKNLCNFTIHTDSEVLISTIVIEEFANYYKTRLLKKQNDYDNIVSSLERDPYFHTDKQFHNISTDIEKAITKFRKKIHSDPNHNVRIPLLNHTYIDALHLTNFILDSKNQVEAKIQVRDYLIWDSILSEALNQSVDKVEKFGKRKIKLDKGIIYFITKDKIFQEGELFIKRQKELGVLNIEIFNSIPQFLHKKGFNIAFLNAETILNKISNSKVLKDLSKDLGSLLSYVSPRYDSDECNKRKVINAEIIDKEIIEFYSYYDDADKKPKYVAHLKVYVNVVFEKDNDYNKEAGTEYGHYLETYDNKGRPYYKSPILFIYRGLLDEEKQTIKSVQFIDFIPDLYV